MKGKAGSKSEEKANSLSKIDETYKEVKLLRGHIDFLLSEVSRLVSEREEMSKQVSQLQQDLKHEREEHAKTKKKIDELLKEILQRDERILELKIELERLEMSNG